MCLCSGLVFTSLLDLYTALQLAPPVAQALLALYTLYTCTAGGGQTEVVCVVYTLQILIAKDQGLYTGCYHIHSRHGVVVVEDGGTAEGHS